MTATVHKLRTGIKKKDNPEFDDGDGGDEDTSCSNCKWWQYYNDDEFQDEEGNPTLGSCRYDTPPWTDTEAIDWCRRWEAES